MPKISICTDEVTRVRYEKGRYEDQACSDHQDEYYMAYLLEMHHTGELIIAVVFTKDSEDAVLFNYTEDSKEDDWSLYLRNWLRGER